MNRFLRNILFTNQWLSHQLHQHYGRGFKCRSNNYKYKEKPGDSCCNSWQSSRLWHNRSPATRLPLIAPEAAFLRLIHTSCIWCCGVQQTVELTQRDRKFLSLHWRSLLQNLQTTVASVNEPFGIRDRSRLRNLPLHISVVLPPL